LQGRLTVKLKMNTKNIKAQMYAFPIPEVKEKLRKRYGDRIPLNETVILSALFITIISN
jgi:hypothetical protein